MKNNEFSEAAKMPLILNTLLKNRTSEQSFELRMALLDSDEKIPQNVIADYFSEDDLKKVKKIHWEKIKEQWNMIKANHEKVENLTKNCGNFTLSEVFLNAVGLMSDDEKFESVDKRDQKNFDEADAILNSDKAISNEVELWEMREKKLAEILGISDTSSPEEINDKLTE